MTKQRFTNEAKLDILDQCRNMSASEAASCVGVCRSSIVRWRAMERRLRSSDPSALKADWRTAITQVETENESDSANLPQARLEPKELTCPSTTHFDAHTTYSIGYSGQKNGINEIAAQSIFKDKRVILAGYPYDSDVMKAISNGEVDFGIVVSSYLFSTISTSALDLFGPLSLGIVAEFDCELSVYQYALPGTTLRACRCVMFEQFALNQCAQVIEEIESKSSHDVIRQIVWSDAAACRTIKDENLQGVIVIANERAARLSNLVMIQDNGCRIQADMLVIAQRQGTQIFDELVITKELVDPRIAVLITISDRCSWLARIYTALKELNVDIASIVSQEPNRYVDNRQALTIYIGC